MRIRQRLVTTVALSSAGFAMLALAAAALAAAVYEVNEVEPNDTLALANPLAEPLVGVGSITPIGDIDSWVRSGATLGHEIFALVETPPGSDRARLSVFDDAGNEFDSNDTDGEGLQPALAGVPVPIGGDVFYGVSEFGNNGTLATYRLFQGILDPATSVEETEPNDTSVQASSATPQSLVSGSGTMADTDFFSIPLEAGTELAVLLDRDPEGDLTYFASLIDVFEPDGSTLLASGDPTSGNAHAVGPFTASASGSYFVRITSVAGGSDTDYRMAFVTAAPEPAALGSALACLGTLGGLIRRRARRRSQA